MVKIFKVFVPVSVIALLIGEAAILFGCYLAGLYLAELLLEAPVGVQWHQPNRPVM